MHWSSPVQLEQVPPPVPQKVVSLPERQVSPSQHPEQEFWVHSQVPPTHSWPAPQEEQAAPPVPQALSVPVVTQSPCWSQQPLGQEEGPQVGSALSLQVFCSHAWLSPHSWQVVAPLPQAASLSPPRQLPLSSQQPVQLSGPQVTAWQVPPWQLCPSPQVVHWAPPVPQADLLVPGVQVPFWQQPLGQVVASQF